jgi:metallopeptidase MepB
LFKREQKSYIRNRLRIPAKPKRDRFKEIKKRLSEISTDFEKVLNKENKGLWVTKEEIEGVLEDVVGGLEKGTREHNKKIKLFFKYLDLFLTLKFALNSELRKKIFIKNKNKVSYITLNVKTQTS